MADFIIRWGNTRDPLRVTLKSGDQPVDISNATSITFRLWAPNGSMLINTTSHIDVLTIIGQCQYTFQSGDYVAVVPFDNYHAAFDVVFSDGSSKTFPNDQDPNGPHLFVKVTATNK